MFHDFFSELWLTSEAACAWLHDTAWVVSWDSQAWPRIASIATLSETTAGDVSSDSRTGLAVAKLSQSFGWKLPTLSDIISDVSGTSPAFYTIKFSY